MWNMYYLSMTQRRESRVVGVGSEGGLSVEEEVHLNIWMLERAEGLLGVARSVEGQ